MPLTDNAKNQALDGMTLAYMSLHSAYSATGANELAGGSPAYARKPCTFNAASGGARALSADVVFDVEGGDTVAFIGLWTAQSGTFQGMVPNGSSAPKTFVVDDTTADTIECPAHGLSNDNRVVFFGSALPAGLTEGTIYWVVSATTDDFKVSTTQGGAAVSITAVGKGVFQKCVVESFGGQGTFTVQAASTSVSLNVV